MHCDKHAVKMLAETVQMLSTAHRLKGGYSGSVLPKATHVNHPSTVWVRSSAQNYLWAVQLYNALCDEYLNRYGREHAYASYEIRTILNQIPQDLKPDHDEDHVKMEALVTSDLDIDWSKFPLCMPEMYKRSSDPVECYRDFYFCEKRRFARWKDGNKPEWFSEFEKVLEPANEEALK